MQANKTLDPLAVGEGLKKAETKRKIQEILQEPVESKRMHMGGGSGVSTTDNPLLELPMDLHRYNILKLMWKTLHLLYSFLWFQLHTSGMPAHDPSRGIQIPTH